MAKHCVSDVNDGDLHHPFDMHGQHKQCKTNVDSKNPQEQNGSITVTYADVNTWSTEMIAD